MFASSTIISARGTLAAPTQFLELCYKLFLVNIRKRLGNTIRCGPEFSDGNRGIGF
jgi:hypothetical protein